MEITIKNKPLYDPDFSPIGAYKRAYEQGAAIPFCIAAERGDGLSTMELRLRGAGEADCIYAERMAKTLLWQKGGYRLYVCGPQEIYRYIAGAYRSGGARQFDAEFMQRVYGHPFEVMHRDYTDKPQSHEAVRDIGRHLTGCRIGFDAGGSDRKVSAVIDGETVFSEEVVWHPKTNADPDYHYNGIIDAMKSAAAHMPRIDGIGVSSAGIYIQNHTAVASLFRAVPPALFDIKVRDIYLRAAAEMGDVPIEVCNDGDVTALAGSMYFGRSALLGIAMGTAEAAGFVDGAGHITGWLNELAFVPVDMHSRAMEDEWSGDIGCGVTYFSQDGVIKLAGYAGFPLPDDSPAQKLKIVQEAAEEKDMTARQIFADTGCYLGHTLPFYHDLYQMEHVLLLGRVMSGVGGEIILDTAKRVLAEEYPGLSIGLLLPDDTFRRVGQSMAAASLPAARGS